MVRLSEQNSAALPYATTMMVPLLGRLADTGSPEMWAALRERCVPRRYRIKGKETQDDPPTEDHSPAARRHTATAAATHHLDVPLAARHLLVDCPRPLGCRPV